MPKKPINKKKVPRNNSIVDVWSFVHLATSTVLTLFLGPLTTLIIVTIWEPFEIFILSPLLAKKGKLFGHESLGNSISDIAFNTIGVIIGVYLSG